jgi:hypothetical protein
MPDQSARPSWHITEGGIMDGDVMACDSCGDEMKRILEFLPASGVLAVANLGRSEGRLVASAKDGGLHPPYEYSDEQVRFLYRIHLEAIVALRPIANARTRTLGR